MIPGIGLDGTSKYRGCDIGTIHHNESKQVLIGTLQPNGTSETGGSKGNILTPLRVGRSIIDPQGNGKGRVSTERD